MGKISVLCFSFLYYALASWESTLNNGSLDGFFTLDEIYADMDTIASSFPDIASIGTIGLSTKGDKHISYIKLAGEGIPDIEKGGALITSSLFSGYPTNPSFVMYMLKDFANSYSKNSPERTILLKSNIWFIPVINVDAYKQMEENYATAGFEVIKKNFKETGCDNTTQNGVNLDRNWEFNWKNSTGDSSSNPCDSEYRGTSAFSEVETRNLKNFIIDKNITVWIHFDEDKNVYILPYTSMNMEPITLPDPVFDWAYDDLKSFFPKVNLTYGTAKKIDGKFEDGTLIDFALSKGIFSMKGEIALYDKSENITSFFNPHLQSAIWNIDGASYSLGGDYYYSWYECSEYPEYCQKNDSSIFFENEVHITNYGFKEGKTIAYNFTWNYSDNISGYNFILQPKGYYTLYRVIDDQNTTDTISVDFSDIKTDEGLISAVLYFDIPALTYVEFFYYIEGTIPSGKNTMKSYWNISLYHEGLPDSEATTTNIDWEIKLDSDRNDSDDDDGDSHISKGVIAGIAIGVIVIFLIIIIGLIIYCRKRRRDSNSGLMKQTYEPAFKDSQPSKGFSPPFEIQIPPERFEPQRI